MPLKDASAADVTGPLWDAMFYAGTAYWHSRTGIEFPDYDRFHHFARLEKWGVKVIIEQIPADENPIVQAARAQPSVESSLPVVPELSDNLIVDVKRVCGLTSQQLADVLGVTERTVLSWKRGVIPDDRQGVLEALRAIGSILVGGLGPDGVRRWLFAGAEPPVEQIRAGRIAEVAKTARSYEESVAG